MNTRYKEALLLCAMMLIAAAPPAFGTIIYGGANVEVPTSTPATAVGDAGTLNNRVGALGFTAPKMIAGAGWPALMNLPNNGIVLDPSAAAGAFQKYCRSWVFTGATLPAATVGDAAAEWTGTLAPASASEVLDTADTVIMSASANGQSHSEVHATNTAGTIPTTAQTLIDAWAGSRIAGAASDRDLYGNAQITSTAQTNAAGSVSTGATASGYTGNTEPQPYAVAGFSAQRITMSSGSTRVPGAISGTVTGTTSVEIANANGGRGDGYATANTYAMAAASDLPNTRSYSLSEIRSSARADRSAAAPNVNRRTAVLARSDGTASSEAWDSSRNWASPTALGTGNSITSVAGKTVAQATAMRAGDIVLGDSLTLPGILGVRSPDGLQTWSQMLAVAAKGQSVIQAPTPDERDAFTFAYTSARVRRTSGNPADANMAFGATWLGSAATTDANLPLTSGASLNAKSAETQSGFNTAATLSNIGMSSGAHAKGAAITAPGPIFQGSTAKLATKAHFTGVGVAPQEVAIGNVLAYPAGTVAPVTGLVNGFVTNGPGFTGQGWDDGGSYIIAGTQDATTTGSSGTYRLTAQPTDVREWVTGASLLNNNWILQRPAPMNWQKPQTVNAVPNLQEIPVAGRNPDSYQWSGEMNGPS